MLYKIESLRGIMACAVIIAHSSVSIGENEFYFWRNLDILIEYFFVLSGLVMALAYEDKIKSGLSFKSYFILRFGRIYPLHIFTLLLWFFYLLIKQINGFETEFELKDNIWTFVSNIFLLHSMGIHDGLSWNFPSWSISTEFYTYLLFYIFLVTIDKKRKLLIPILIVIVSYTIVISLNKEYVGALTYDYGFFRTIGAFYLGIIIYRFKKKLNYNIGSAINTYEFSFVFCFLFLILLPMRIPFHDLLIIFTLASFVYIFSENKSGFLGKILKHNMLVLVGKYSYSIYLLHIFVISIYEIVYDNILGVNLNSIRGVHSILLNGAFCLTTIVLSKYSFIYIEDFFRQKSKAFVKKEVLIKNKLNVL